MATEAHLLNATVGNVRRKQAHLNGLLPVRCKVILRCTNPLTLTHHEPDHVCKLNGLCLIGAVVGVAGHADVCN